MACRMPASARAQLPHTTHTAQNGKRPGSGVGVAVMANGCKRPLAHTAAATSTPLPRTHTPLLPLLQARDCVLLCDDDNDMELAAQVAKAFLPSVTSVRGGGARRGAGAAPLRGLALVP